MPCCPLSYGALRYRSRDVSYFQQTLLMITATCKLVIDVGIRKARWQGPVLRVLAGFRRCDAYNYCCSSLKNCFIYLWPAFVSYATREIPLSIIVNARVFVSGRLHEEHCKHE